jgi:hypothetical protein
MRTSATLLLCLVTAVLGLSCAPPTPEPQSGSESHFLETCDEPCATGLTCVCGVCTVACDSGTSCSAVATAASCVASADRAAASACEAASGGFCDVPCAASSDCGPLGPSFFCLGGFCRVDPQYRPGEPVPGFGGLCEQPGLSCSSAANPPNLVGDYSGQGTVVLSSNAIWAVGDSDTVSVQITQQANDVLAGTIDLQSLSLTVDGAAVRGDVDVFSLYATGSTDVSGCSAETRVLISGTLDQSVSPATVSGALALRFTGNFAAQGCSADQLTSYPATGANFRHTETRLR